MNVYYVMFFLIKGFQSNEVMYFIVSGLFAIASDINLYMHRRLDTKDYEEYEEED